MLITLEPRRTFGSNVAYLCSFSLATGIQNGDEASQSIILPGRALSVKMLTTLESN